jgi:hypothetical protein
MLILATEDLIPQLLDEDEIPIIQNIPTVIDIDELLPTLLPVKDVSFYVQNLNVPIGMPLFFFFLRESHFPFSFNAVNSANRL